MWSAMQHYLFKILNIRCVCLPFQYTWLHPALPFQYTWVHLAFFALVRVALVSFLCSLLCELSLSISFWFLSWFSRFLLIYDFDKILVHFDLTFYICGLYFLLAGLTHYICCVYPKSVLPALYVTVFSMFNEFSFDNYFTYFVPVFKYCYSDSRNLWTVMRAGGLAP